MSWERKSLSEIAKVGAGNSAPQGDHLFSSDGIPFFRTSDVGRIRFGEISESFDRLSELGRRGLRLFPKRTILFPKSGASTFLNHRVMLATEGFVSSHLATIVADEMQVLGKYLLYFLATVKAQDLVQDHAYPSLNLPLIAAIRVPVPSLAEQHRIVAILDEVFAGIATARANAKQNLHNARATFRSYLQSVFTQRWEGWQQKPLAELCESARVITYGVIKLGDETPEGVPCLRTSNVRWLRIETEGMKRITAKLSEEYSRTILRGGEVLVNVRGTLGGVAVASPEMAGWNVSREVAVVPIDATRIDPYFLSYLIGTGTSQEWLGGMRKGAAYVGINIEDLRLLPISVPPMAEQLEIVSELGIVHADTKRLESLYTRKLAALDELKQSLLRQAFSGQL